MKWAAHGAIDDSASIADVRSHVRTDRVEDRDLALPITERHDFLAIDLEDSDRSRWNVGSGCDAKPA
jgi:hypothetical protein